MNVESRAQMVLEEMRRSMDLNDNTSDVLDQKANTIIGNTSVIVGIFMTFHIAIFNISKTSLYWIEVVLIIMAYICIIFLCSSSYWPMPYKRPIQANWNEVSVNLLQNKQKALLERIISSYIDCIKINRKNNDQKVIRIRISALLMFFIVFILGIISIGYMI